MQDNHPESHKFKPAEVKYSTYDKELSTVIHALKMWKHYLMDFEFIVKTDQQSIKHLLSQHLISFCHIKWAIFIQSFQTILQYHPGKENVVADALSRRPQLNHMSVIEGVSFASTPDTYAHDEDFKEVWLHVHEHTTHTLVDYTFHDNFLYFKCKLCVTKPFC